MSAPKPSLLKKLLPASLALCSAAASAQFEEVIVTAQRVESNLSTTPIAMSAFTETMLKDRGVTDPTRLNEIVPNLSIDRANGLQITIRGVTSTDGTEKGDPSAAFLLDGIYLPRPQTHEVSFYDVQRVEVLRGPQGTLYGRNTTAGVINVITARPVDEFEASFDTNIGNYGLFQTTGMINVPVSDSVAVRIAGNWDERESYFDSPNDPYSLDPFRESQAYRISTSIDFTDNLNLWLKYDWAEIDSVGINTVPVDNMYDMTDPSRPRHKTADADDVLVWPYAQPFQSGGPLEDSGITAELNWDNDWGTITYLTSYRESERQFDGYIATLDTPDYFYGDYEYFSHELRYAFEVGNLTGQVGYYYFEEESGIGFFILEPYKLGIPFGYEFGFPQDPTKAESEGFFGDVTYAISDTWRVTAGVRETNDLKSRVGKTTVRDENHQDIVVFQINDAEEEWEKTTWRLGTDFDVGDLGMAYLKVSTGYKAGGFNDGCEIGQGPACGLPAEALYYDPEELTAYEGGFKWRMLEDTLSVDLAVFYYDYEGLQLSQVADVCGGPCQVTTNAAEAVVQGIELETSWLLTDNQQLDVSMTTLDAYYDDFKPNPNTDWKDEPLSRSPDFTATVAYTYTMPLENAAELKFNIRSMYNDGYEIGDLANLRMFEQPSYTKTDITVTYTAADDRYFVQGYVKNIEDEVALSTAADDIAVQDPQTYGIRFGYKWN